MKNAVIAIAILLIAIAVLDPNMFQGIVNLFLGTVLQAAVLVLSCEPLVALLIIGGLIWFFFIRRRAA